MTHPKAKIVDKMAKNNYTLICGEESKIISTAWCNYLGRTTRGVNCWRHDWLPVGGNSGLLTAINSGRYSLKIVSHSLLIIKQIVISLARVFRTYDGPSSSASDLWEGHLQRVNQKSLWVPEKSLHTTIELTFWSVTLTKPSICYWIKAADSKYAVRIFQYVRALRYDVIIFYM